MQQNFSTLIRDKSVTNNNTKLKFCKMMRNNVPYRHVKFHLNPSRSVHITLSKNRPDLQISYKKISRIKILSYRIQFPSDSLTNTTDFSENPSFIRVPRTNNQIYKKPRPSLEICVDIFFHLSHYSLFLTF